MLTDRYLPVNVLISLLNDLISKKYLMQTRHEAARVRLLFQSVGFYSGFYISRPNHRYAAAIWTSVHKWKLPFSLILYHKVASSHTSDPTIPVHEQQNQNNWIKEAESCVEVQFPGEFSTTSDTWFNVHVKTITSRNFKPNVVTKSQLNYYLVNRKSNSDKEQKSHAFLNSVMTNDTAWNIFNNNTKSYSVATLMIHVLNFIS